jgi:hypothetical protein
MFDVHVVFRAEIKKNLKRLRLHLEFVDLEVKL